MKHTQSKTSAIILCILFIVYGVGVAGHIDQSFFDSMIILTPWILLASALIIVFQILLSSQRTNLQKRRILLWLLLCYVLSHLIEAVGVMTGAIFGQYVYGTVLGISLLKVPLIIGLNWCMVILALAETMRMKRVSILLWLLLAPAWAVLFDSVLEPVAVNLGYWHWSAGGVPPQNYWVWGILAFVFSVFYFWMVPYPKMDDASPSLNRSESFFRSSERYFPGIAMFLQFLFIALLNLFRVT